MIFYSLLIISVLRRCKNNTQKRKQSAWSQWDEDPFEPALHRSAVQQVTSQSPVLLSLASLQFFSAFWHILMLAHPLATWNELRHRSYSFQAIRSYSNGVLDPIYPKLWSFCAPQLNETNNFFDLRIVYREINDPRLWPALKEIWLIAAHLPEFLISHHAHAFTPD